MRAFLVTATVGRTVGGYWRVAQVPVFVLDGDVHGLQTEQDAERFAEQMLTDVAGEGSAASACAVEV